MSPHYKVRKGRGGYRTGFLMNILTCLVDLDKGAVLSVPIENELKVRELERTGE